jgi:hypothetical protein
MADSIDRTAFFDALRQFFPTKNVHETRIYPDRVEVHRFVRGEDGNVLHDAAGNLYHTVETHWLGLGDVADPVDNSHS